MTIISNLDINSGLFVTLFGLKIIFQKSGYVRFATGNIINGRCAYYIDFGICIFVPSAW